MNLCVFTVLGGREVVATPDFLLFRNKFEEFLKGYRERRFLEAERLLQGLDDPARQLGAIGLLNVYRNRLAQYQLTPPATSWDGIFVAERK